MSKDHFYFIEFFLLRSWNTEVFSPDLILLRNKTTFVGLVLLFKVPKRRILEMVPSDDNIRSAI
jgi:hypothetical protein